MPPPFLKRVKLRNYKSIAACDVTLEPLTMLVGPNGAGKSNFIDALRLVADALNAPMDHALRQRGGIDEVRRRSRRHPHNFAIELNFETPDGVNGVFTLEVAADKAGAFRIKRECLRAGILPEVHYDVRSGEVVRCSLEHPPIAAKDRLYLVNLSGASVFRSVYDAFSTMGFYNLDPVQIRSVQAPDPGAMLSRNGQNIASMVHRLTTDSPETMSRVRRYLHEVVPGIRDVSRIQIANQETLEFRQDVQGSDHPWRFYANSMSDGTLRALGILVAIFQRDTNGEAAIPLVGIEEPETALHPAAAGVLLEALRHASEHTQIIATTHSPQLIDDKELHPNQLLAVASSGGVTRIGRLDDKGRLAMQEHLFTAGELLSQSMLQPHESAITSPEELVLFGTEDT